MRRLFSPTALANSWRDYPACGYGSWTISPIILAPYSRKSMRLVVAMAMARRSWCLPQRIKGAGAGSSTVCERYIERNPVVCMKSSFLGRRTMTHSIFTNWSQHFHLICTSLVHNIIFTNFFSNQQTNHGTIYLQNKTNLPFLPSSHLAYKPFSYASYKFRAPRVLSLGRAAYCLILELC